MEIIRGIGVFPGVAISTALVLDQEGFTIRRPVVSPDLVPDEIERLDQCLRAVADQITENAQVVSQRFGPQVAKIFEAHRYMVLDPHLRQMLVKNITEDYCSAESAVRKVFRQYEDFFRSSAKEHFLERVSDIRDIERQLLAKLLGERRSSLRNITTESIILAHDLSPTETAGLNPKFVRGMATETGGRTSHTAIVAGAMEIPAVVGLGKFPASLAEGQTVIVDGNRGVLIIDPDEKTLEKYRSSERDFLRFERSLAQLRDLPAETLDGVRVRLLGNIEFPHEAEHCIERGAEGIGLYRTEFLYLNRQAFPTEEEHVEAYSKVLKVMGPNRPVVFRTMDLGADKLYHGDHPPEPNPFLGLRSVRLSLRNLPIFKTQLRALLRVSLMGDVRIMFPLISTMQELRKCRIVLADVMEDLEEDGIEFRSDLPVGMMVEVPSAALLADQFAQGVDFFSIGTNDLIQYTLAVDRNNETVAPLYSASDPAVLKLVRQVVRSAEKKGISANVCGEMSGDPVYTLLLLGLGLRQFSVTPHNIPEIKKVVRSVTIAEAKKVANRALRLDTAGEVTRYLRNRTRHIVPELIDELG